jgi:hypothetical protein
MFPFVLQPLRGSTDQRYFGNRPYSVFTPSGYAPGSVVFVPKSPPVVGRKTYSYSVSLTFSPKDVETFNLERVWHSDSGFEPTGIVREFTRIKTFYYNWGPLPYYPGIQIHFDSLTVLWNFLFLSGAHGSGSMDNHGLFTWRVTGVSVY